jgi:hypothetical protein
VPLPILHHIAQALPCVIPGPLGVSIAERPLHRVGPRTVCRQPEQRKVGVARQPLLDGLRFINTGVIHDDREARHPRSRVRGVQHRQAVTKHPRVFAWPEAIEHLARSHRSHRERPRQSVLRVLAWCHPLCLRPLWHPGRSALRQEVASACLRTPHHRMRVPVGVMPPPPDQTVDPVRVVILGDPRGPFPPPPIAWSQRRTVSADTALPCLALSVAARVAQRHRVRHQPYVCGAALRKAPRARVSQGSKTVGCTATERGPSGSIRLPRPPARYACTIRDTLERAQNRPAAHRRKMWHASREPSRVWRRTARLWPCSAGGISRQVVDGTVGAP